MVRAGGPHGRRGTGRISAGEVRPAAEQTAAPADKLGIQGGWAIDDAGSLDFPHSLRSQLPLIQAAGARWVRVNFRLGGCYRDWTTPGCNGTTALAQYDVLIDDIRARGLQVLGVISYESWPGAQADWIANNAEHMPGGNGDNTYLRAFAQQAAVALARHFQGRITDWEVWNEPNVWSGNPRPGVYEGDVFLYPSNFAWLLRHVYEGARNAGLAGLTIISGGLSGENFPPPPQPERGPPALWRGDYLTTAEAATPGATPAALNSGARYLTATYRMGLAHAGWDDLRRRFGSYPLDAVGQHLYVDQDGPVAAATLFAFLDDTRAAYTAFEGVATPKPTVLTEFGWTTGRISQAVQAANIQTALAVFRATRYVAGAYLYSVQDVPEAFPVALEWGLHTGGDEQDGFRGAPKLAFHAYGAAVGAAASAGARVWVVGDHVVLQPPGRPPVTLAAGTVPRAPDQWCGRERVYRRHVRLDDPGVGGAVFGVAAGGFFDWVPPEEAGCVDWSTLDATVQFPKEVVMQFRLLRPRPGSLLWVQDGGEGWRGRLYEVGADGQARYVTPVHWQANQAHYQRLWPNVLPVSWLQIEDFRQRGLVGPDL